MTRALRKLLEPLRPERVETHRDPIETRFAQRSCPWSKHDTIRRHRQITDRSLGPDQTQQVRKLSSQERFTPVMRTLRTPTNANTSTKRLSSSNVRMSPRGSQVYSSSGMQYRHRRLHRSVTEGADRAVGDQTYPRPARPAPLPRHLP